MQSKAEVNSTDDEVEGRVGQREYLPVRHGAELDALKGKAQTDKRVNITTEFELFRFRVQLNQVRIKTTRSTLMKKVCNVDPRERCVYEQ